MPRVLTNNTAWAYSIESALGTAGTTWYQVEPNDVPQFGSQIATAERAPILSRRTRRKGIVTDLDSGVEFPMDLTLSHLDNIAEGFFYATPTNSDLLFRGADITSSGVTIPSATAAQAAKLQYGATAPISLIYNRGYVETANNGLKPITVDVTATDTVIEFSGAAAETAPTNAESEVAGIRCYEADLDITVSSGTATLTSGNGGGTAVDFTTLGLTAGQYIHIGGLTSANQFSAGAGFARVRTIAAGTLVCDKLDSALATDPGTGETVDLLFGRFIRTVDVSASDYLEQSYHWEAYLPNLGSGPADRYQYAIGNYCNTLAFELPLTDKAGLTAGFIGTDTEVPTGSRKSGASTPILPVKTKAFSTSSDIARLRVADTDDTGLTTDFKSMTLTINNNVSPEKVLATLGATYMNVGNFDVDIQTQVVFTEENVVSRIRNNTTVGLDFRLTNEDGGFVFDIPELTLGDGAYELPVNESVLLNLTGTAFQDDFFGSSGSISLFAAVPA